MKQENIIDTLKCHKDDNGIWVSPINTSEDVQTSKSAWEAVYNFDDTALLKDRDKFLSEKLPAVLHLIGQKFKFFEGMVYLELGCGPGYLGEFLMEKHNALFIGIDFNYKMLLTLKRYLDMKGFKNYILIYGDIHNIPMLDSTVDFIYGGGVIEHTKDTIDVVHENFRLLKHGGGAFNSVPALNFFWIARAWYSIPNIFPLRQLAEYAHTHLLHDKVLNKKFGYELSFPKSTLMDVYIRTGFSKVESGPFYIPPYTNVVRYTIVKKLFNTFFNNNFLSPMYFVFGSRP